MENRITWNVKSGFCPYGHPLKSCHTMYVRPKTGFIEHRCSITRNEQARRARMIGAHLRPPKPPKVPRDRRVKPEDKRKPGKQVLPRVGYLIECDKDTTSMAKAYITLVCGHRTLYMRAYIQDKWRNGLREDLSSPLYCERCRDWKKVHYIPGEPTELKDKEKFGLIAYPLECDEKKVWPSGIVGVWEAPPVIPVGKEGQKVPPSLPVGNSIIRSTTHFAGECWS